MEVEHLDDPRVEKEEHYYRAAHTKLLDLGLVPHLLNRATISSLLAVADRHRDRVDPAAILPDRALARDGQHPAHLGLFGAGHRGRLNAPTPARR